MGSLRSGFPEGGALGEGDIKASTLVSLGQSSPCLPAHPCSPVGTVDSLDLHCSLGVGRENLASLVGAGWDPADGAVSAHSFHLAPGLREAELGVQ